MRELHPCTRKRIDEQKKNIVQIVRSDILCFIRGAQKKGKNGQLPQFLILGQFTSVAVILAKGALKILDRSFLFIEKILKKARTFKIRMFKSKNFFTRHAKIIVL